MILDGGYLLCVSGIDGFLTENKLYQAISNQYVDKGTNKTCVSVVSDTGNRLDCEASRFVIAKPSTSDLPFLNAQTRDRFLPPFKNLDSVICVVATDTFRTGQFYKIIGDEFLHVGIPHVTLMDDYGNHSSAPSSFFKLRPKTLGEEIDEKQKEPPQISISLSTIESVIQELDSIIHPEVGYDRDREKMMQSVIDYNSASAELVKRLIMECLPNRPEFLPQESDSHNKD